MAVDAMKLGAFHYLTKPINFDEMYIIIRNAIEQKRLLNRVEMLTQEVKSSMAWEILLQTTRG